MSFSYDVDLDLDLGLEERLYIYKLHFVFIISSSQVMASNRHRSSKDNGCGDFS